MISRYMFLWFLSLGLLALLGCDSNPDGPSVPPNAGLSGQAKAAQTKTAKPTNRPAVPLHTVE